MPEQKRPIYTGPETIENPYYDKPEEDQTQTADVKADTPAPSMQKETPYWLQVGTTSGNAEHAAIARNILDKKQYKSEHHKKRLEQIIESSQRGEDMRTRMKAERDTEFRKVAQARADEEVKALYKQVATGRYNTGEVNRAYESIRNRGMLMIAGNPITLTKEHAEKDNPEAVIAQTANDIMKNRNLPPAAEDIIRRTIVVDKGTGKIDIDSLKAVEEALVVSGYSKRPGSIGSSAERAAIKDDLRNIEAELKQLATDEENFDQETKQPLDDLRDKSTTVSASTFGLVGGYSREQVANRNWARARHQELTARKEDYIKRQRGFATGYQESSGPAATAEAMEAPITSEPTATPGVTQPTPKPVPAETIGSTQANPMEVAEGQTEDEAFAAALKQSRSTNPPSTVWVRIGTQVYPVR